ncbi:uncharacterized protein LOC143244343 isoform X3 [Tachypleus tridentatus]
MMGLLPPELVPDVPVFTSLPPAVDGCVQCYLQLHIPYISWVKKSKSAITVSETVSVKVRWWGEDVVGGAVFIPRDLGDISSPSEAKTTAKYKVCSGSKQFLTYLTDMRELVAEVQTESTFLGFAVVGKLSNLTVTSVIAGVYPVVTAEGKKVADLYISISLHRERSAFDCSKIDMVTEELKENHNAEDFNSQKKNNFQGKTDRLIEANQVYTMHQQVEQNKGGPKGDRKHKNSQVVENLDIELIHAMLEKARHVRQKDDFDDEEKSSNILLDIKDNERDEEFSEQLIEIVLGEKLSQKSNENFSVSLPSFESQVSSENMNETDSCDSLPNDSILQDLFYNDSKLNYRYPSQGHRPPPEGLDKSHLDAYELLSTALTNNVRAEAQSSSLSQEMKKRKAVSSVTPESLAALSHIQGLKIQISELLLDGHVHASKQLLRKRKCELMCKYSKSRSYLIEVSSSFVKGHESWDYRGHRTKSKEPLKFVSRRENGCVVSFHQEVILPWMGIQKDISSVINEELVFKVRARFHDRRENVEIGSCRFYLWKLFQTELLEMDLEEPLHSDRSGKKSKSCFAVSQGLLKFSVKFCTDEKEKNLELWDRNSSKPTDTPKKSSYRTLNNQMNRVTYKSKKDEDLSILQTTPQKTKVSANIEAVVHDENVSIKPVLLHCLIHISPSSSWIKNMVTNKTYLFVRSPFTKDVLQGDFHLNDTETGSCAKWVLPIMVTKELLKKIQNNILIVEVWDRDIHDEDKLIGLGKVSLQDLFWNFKDPIVMEGLQYKKIPLKGVDGHVAIINPLSGVTKGEICMFLAVGTLEQINRAEACGYCKKFVSGSEIKVSEELPRIQFEIQLIALYGMKLKPSENWNETNYIIRYYFPVISNRSSDSAVKMQVYQTASFHCKPEVKLDYKCQHTISLSSEDIKEVLASGICMELRCLNGFCCEETLIAKGEVAIVKLLEVLDSKLSVTETVTVPLLLSKNISHLELSQTVDCLMWLVVRLTNEIHFEKEKEQNALNSSCRKDVTVQTEELNMPNLNKYPSFVSTSVMVDSDTSPEENDTLDSALKKNCLNVMHNKAQQTVLDDGGTQSPGEDEPQLQHSIYSLRQRVVFEEEKTKNIDNKSGTYSKPWKNQYNEHITTSSSSTQDAFPPSNESVKDGKLEELEKPVFLRTAKASTEYHKNWNQSVQCLSVPSEPSEITHIMEEEARQITFNEGHRFWAHVSVEQALHLSKVYDRNRKEHILPSSYVTLECTISEQKILSTGVVENTDNPEWNWDSDLWLTYSQENKDLIFKVWHAVDSKRNSSDQFYDKVIGFVSVDLSPLTFGFQYISGWYNILNLTGQCCGQMKVTVTPHNQLSHTLKSNSRKKDELLEVLPNYFDVPYLEVLPYSKSNSIFYGLLKKQLAELDTIQEKLTEQMNQSSNKDTLKKNGINSHEFHSSAKTPLQKRSIASQNLTKVDEVQKFQKIPTAKGSSVSTMAGESSHVVPDSYNQNKESMGNSLSRTFPTQCIQADEESRAANSAVCHVTVSSTHQFLSHNNSSFTKGRVCLGRLSEFPILSPSPFNTSHGFSSSQQLRKDDLMDSHLEVFLPEDHLWSGDADDDEDSGYPGTGQADERWLKSKHSRTVGRERSINGSYPHEKEKVNEGIYVQMSNMAINKENSWTSDNPSSPQENDSLPEGSINFQQTFSKTRDFITLPICTSCGIRSYGNEMRAVSPDLGEMKTNDTSERVLEIVQPFSPVSLEVQQVISASVKDSFCSVGATTQDHTCMQELSFSELFKVEQEKKNKHVEHKENTCPTTDDVSDMTEEMEDVERSKVSSTREMIYCNRDTKNRNESPFSSSSWTTHKFSTFPNFFLPAQDLEKSVRTFRRTLLIPSQKEEVNSEDKLKSGSLQEDGYELTKEETQRTHQILSKSL